MIDYVTLMCPVCQALDILQGEKSVSMGYLAITILKDKLVAKKEKTSCIAVTALADALIDSLDRRFASYLDPVKE